MNIHKNIDEIKSLISNNTMVMIYISSESCNVCKVIYPGIENMLKSFPLLKAARANIDELPLLSGEYNVFTVPCVLVFAEGKEIIREARYINIQAIEEKIARYYNMIYKE